MLEISLERFCNSCISNWYILPPNTSMFSITVSYLVYYIFTKLHLKVFTTQAINLYIYHNQTEINTPETRLGFQKCGQNSEEWKLWRVVFSLTHFIPLGCRKRPVVWNGWIISFNTYFINPVRQHTKKIKWLT